MLIQRINKIEQIKSLQVQYQKDTGLPVYNVSNWLTSAQFNDVLLQKFEPPQMESPIEYIYTYSISNEISKKVLRKLGSTATNETVVFMPNTTTAIINIINFLKQYQYKNICIITPSYFSIENTLKVAGLNYKTCNLEFDGENYHIPYEKILANNFDAVWITSPIFSTSVSFSAKEIQKLKNLMKKQILVISDESFCIKGNELLSQIAISPYFIAIYSPHKSICMNSFKFSVIVCDPCYAEFLLQWVDVICGNLPASTYNAIYHYTTPNFDKCFFAYEKFMKDALASIKSIFKKYNTMTCNLNNLGSMYTIYDHKNTYEQSTSIEFLQQLIYDTGVSIYPGYLNGFPKNYGFCYRINLALYNNEFIMALQKIWNYLR